jgi:hypothetical protein
MKKILISTFIFLSILSFYNCKDNTKSESKNLTKEILFTKQGELTLLKGESDSIISKLDIEIADNEYKTQTGLMYRNSMEENQAMLFIFPDEQKRSFYMKNTEIALDILYFNSEKILMSLQKNAKPFDQTSLPSETVSQYVLEVNAGLSDKWNLEKGDRFEFTRNE